MSQKGVQNRNKIQKVLNGKGSIPESDFVQASYTIREMRLPQDVKLTKNSLLRWFALSLGLISEEETRKNIIPVLDSLFYFQLKEKRAPTIKELADRSKLPEKAVRYHLGKLQDIHIVQEDKRKYFLSKDPYSSNPNLLKSFQEHYSSKLAKAMTRIEEALQEIQRMYE